MTTWQDVLRPGDATDFFTRVALPAFDPTTSAYVEGNALWLAELSRLVYRHDIEESNPPPRPPRRSFLDQVGLQQRRFFLCTETDTQAMLVTSGSPPRFAVLVFRGTDTPRDSLTDITLGLQFLRRRPGLHRGFRRALDSIWSQVEAELTTLTCPVFFTGHSLGAALATLAAARRAPQAVYNFGAPRVGNRAFARSMRHVPIHRVVDDIDLVSMIPPAFMGFRHVGQEVRLRAPRGSGAFFINPLAWRTKPPALLADHAPVNYIDRMPSARHATE